MVANVNQASGGILERFNGWSIPILGVTFDGASAIAGIYYLHSTYPTQTATPVEIGTKRDTTYHAIEPDTATGPIGSSRPRC